MVIADGFGKAHKHLVWNAASIVIYEREISIQKLLHEVKANSLKICEAFQGVNYTLETFFTDIQAKFECI